MPDSKKNAPKAGRRAKGALPSSAQNQVSNPLQTVVSKTTRRPYFLRQDLTPIHVSGKVARTLTALISSGGNGITARQCGPWAYRLAAYWLPIPAGALSYLSLRVGPFRIDRTPRLGRLGRLRDEATTVLSTGENMYDWANRVAVPRIASAAVAAAASGDVVILADRAHPGTVRPGPVEPPAPAPKPNPKQRS